MPFNERYAQALALFEEKPTLRLAIGVKYAATKFPGFRLLGKAAYNGEQNMMIFSICRRKHNRNNNDVARRRIVCYDKAKEIAPSMKGVESRTRKLSVVTSCALKKLKRKRCNVRHRQAFEQSVTAYRAATLRYIVNFETGGTAWRQRRGMLIEGQ